MAAVCKDSLKIFIFLVVAASLSAADIWISPTGTGDGLTESTPLGSIQAGINAAIAASVSVVTALPGVYNCSTVVGNCNVVWGGSSITLRSRDGPWSTIITGTFYTSAFAFDNTTDAPTIEGFTITGFSNTAIVTSAGLNSFTLRNSIITANVNPSLYSGVFLIAVSSAASYLFDGVMFSDNGGYAITVKGPGSTLTVKNCQFVRNIGSGAEGCGINTANFYNGGSNNVHIVVEDTNFIQNTGAIYMSTGSLKLKNVNFYHNSATGSKTLRCTSGSSVTVPVKDNVKFCGGTYSASGNYISCSAFGPTLALTDYDGCGVCGGNNTFKDCNGVCWGSNSNCRTIRTWYVSPSGSGNGDFSTPFGSISAAVSAAGYGDTVLLLPGTYSGSANRGISTAGKAILITSQDGLPSTVTIDSSQGTVFSLSSRESYDTVFRGLIFQGNQSVTSPPYAFMVNQSSPTIQNCKFIINIGGAVSIQEASFTRIINTYFNNNYAPSIGGAIVVGSNSPNLASHVSVVHSRFESNFVGAYLGGGAIAINQHAGLTVTNSFFISNSAHEGAAIYMANNALYLKATNNSFNSNSAVLTVKKTVAGPGTLSTTFSGNVFCGSPSSTYIDNAVSSGTWTTATEGTADACGVCDGNDEEMDCNDVCFGFSVWDEPETGCCPLSERDCAGVCNGSHVYDEEDTCCESSEIVCGVCGGSC